MIIDVIQMLSSEKSNFNTDTKYQQSQYVKSKAIGLTNKPYSRVIHRTSINKMMSNVLVKKRPTDK